MSKINKTRYFILGLLADESLSGYDIKQKIDKKMGALWMESYGQIYPELKKMTEEKMITSKSSVRNGRAYNEYFITGKGKESLLEWLKEPPENRIVKHDILLKLFFAKHIKMEEVEEHLKKFKNDFVVASQNLLEMKTKLGLNPSESRDQAYWYIAAFFGETIFKAYINWANKSLEILKKID